MEILLINYCLCILAFLGCYGVAMGAYWILQKAKTVHHKPYEPALFELMWKDNIASTPEGLAKYQKEVLRAYMDIPRTSKAAKDRAASWWKQQRVRKA